jgi:hypothetical protein
LKIAAVMGFVMLTPSISRVRPRTSAAWIC